MHPRSRPQCPESRGAAPGGPSPREQGFLLVTVLLVLALVTVIGTTLIVKSTSELRQSANSEGQARARGYAEAAQADMFYTVANAGLGVVNAAFTPYVNAFAGSNSDAASMPIVPEGQYSNVLANIQTNFPTLSSPASVTGGSYTSSINFRALRADPGSFTKNGQTYYLDYSITGQAVAGVNRRTVVTEGTLRVDLGRKSLNQFILLADDGGSGPGGTSGFFDTSSVYDGPVHVNRNWALSGTPTFLAGASTAESFIWMNNAKNCRGFKFEKVSGQQASPNGCTTPNTNGKGLLYNVDKIELPENAYSQARASLGMDPTKSDGSGKNTPDEPNKGQTCQALRTYLPNCSTIPNGVYVPNENGAVTGGIYVQGNAAVTLSTAGTSQVYRVVDQNGATTTITVNYETRTTTIVGPSGASTVLTGVPNGQFYVSGQITALSGPARTGGLPSPLPPGSVPGVIPPALAARTQLNIAASGRITLTGDVTYTDDPRKVPGAQNVLGIISGTDDVMVGDAAPSDLYVSGAILAGADGQGLGVQSPDRRPARGAVHLLGSLAESMDQLRGQVDGDGNAIAGYADDFRFDQRFFNGAVAPPFFPATTKFGVQAGWPIQRTWNEK